MAPWVQTSAIAAAAFAFGAGAVPPAPTYRLRNGVEMPFLTMGTYGYNDTGVVAPVLAALQAGFRNVDTAHDYNNQRGIGQAVKASGLPRESFMLETKIPGCGLGPSVSIFNCYEDTKKALQDDLQLLGQEYVDIVLIHFPPLGALVTRTCSTVCKEVQDQWRALEEFYAAGKAKAIGVSNYCPSCFGCLEKTAKVFPMLNQVQYHIGMGPDPAGFRTYADEHGLVLQAYSPLGSFVTHKPNPEILSGKLTTELAQAHGKSTVQVALKWLVQHGLPTITSSSNPVHLAEDLDLWSWNLTEAEMQQADAYKLSGSPSFLFCSFQEEEEVHV